MAKKNTEINYSHSSKKMFWNLGATTKLQHKTQQTKNTKHSSNHLLII